MTKEELWDLARRPLLLDGAMGTNLYRLGMRKGACAPLWILDHREAVEGLLAEYVRAGSEMIYAPTFGADDLSLSRAGFSGDKRSLNQRLVELARRAGGQGVLVAGDLSPTGEMGGSREEKSPEEIEEAFAEQIGALEEAGVDLLVGETFFWLPELLALLRAARGRHLPLLCTMTVDQAGRLYSGEGACQAATILYREGAAAVGINCSYGPRGLGPVIRAIREAVPCPVAAKPNAGLPRIDSLGRTVYEMTPERFVREMEKLMDAGATLVGGCCGTTPEHIRRLQEALCVRRGVDHGEDKE